MVAAINQVRAQVAAHEARSASDQHAVVLNARLCLGLRHLNAVLAHLSRRDGYGEWS